MFTDIQVAFQQGGGGGGGMAGRDLSELFELEMDLEKNQYETESPVAFNEQNAQQEQVDEAIRKLQELARRQEQLAEQMRALQESRELAERRAAQLAAAASSAAATERGRLETSRKGLLSELRDPRSLRRAFVLREVLSAPVGLR